MGGDGGADPVWLAAILVAAAVAAPLHPTLISLVAVAAVELVSVVAAVLRVAFLYLRHFGDGFGTFAGA